MTLKEHIANGGKHYQRLHMGNDFWRFVLKGEDFWGHPIDAWQEEVQDIKDEKALVLCPKGVILGHDIMGVPTFNFGVMVIYPKLKNWEEHPEFKNFREMTKEEIFKDETV